MRHYLAVKERQEITDAYLEGHRFMDLVRKHQIGTSTLARLLREFGIKARRKNYPGKVAVQRSLSIEQERIVISKYQEGQSASSLGAEFRCSDATILETLSRYGVKRRRRGPIVMSEEARAKISVATKRRWQNEELREKLLPALLRIGFKPSENGSLYPLLHTAQYRKFRSSIIERDFGRCVRCGRTERLHVHHIKHRVVRMDLLFDPANVETLCNSCHMKEEATRRRKEVP